MKKRMLWVAFLSLAACGEKSEPKSTVRSVHSFLVAPTEMVASKDVGVDCATYGQTSCKSKLCLHADPEPSKGWFCATRCNSDKECPEEWRCGSIYPGFTACAPPKRWVSKAVAVRRAVTP